MVSEELMVFFSCNYKLFFVKPNGEMECIDSLYRVKQVNLNILTYSPVIEGKPSNVIKRLRIHMNDYDVRTFYEELDG